MGIGISIFFIAVGAILTFAVHVVATGVNLDAIGIILMFVGGLGLLVSLVIFGGWGGRRDEVVVEERRVA